MGPDLEVGGLTHWAFTPNESVWYTHCSIPKSVSASHWTTPYAPIPATSWTISNGMGLLNLAEEGSATIHCDAATSAISPSPRWLQCSRRTGVHVTHRPAEIFWSNTLWWYFKVRALCRMVGDKVKNNGSPSSTRAPNRNCPMRRRPSIVPGMVCCAWRTSFKSYPSCGVKAVGICRKVDYHLRFRYVEGFFHSTWISF